MKIDLLSKCEKDVVELLLQGKSNKLIALSLGISERTVEFHLKNIYDKFQVSSRIEFVLKRREATASPTNDELGKSTVDATDQNSDNRDKPDPRFQKRMEERMSR